MPSSSHPPHPAAPNPPATVAGSEGTVLLPALARTGLSFFIFGAVFLLLIGTVITLVTPDRFPVQIRGRVVRLADLTLEQEKLSAEHAMLLAARATLQERLQAPVLRQVETLRHDVQSPGAALLAIDAVRTGFAAAISLPQVSFDAATGTVTLGGEVRDAHGRSVQVLASFVDGLRALPLIASVTEPEYRSDPVSSGGTVSPFTLSLRLHRGT